MSQNCSPVPSRTVVQLDHGLEQSDCINCGYTIRRSRWTSNSRWQHVLSQGERRAQDAARRALPSSPSNGAAREAARTA